MPSVKQAIISDAGVSSRFLPIVKTIPKSMLPIGNKPVMQILVEECLEAGIEHIVLVCREDTIETFRDYFENKREDLQKFLSEMGKPERFNSVSEILNFPKITFILQDSSLPYGTASPVISAKKYLKEGEPFVYLQGDDLVLAEKRDVSVLVEEFGQNSKYAGFMMVQEADFDKTTPGGWVKFKNGSTDQLDYIVEKPKKEDAPSNLQSYGRFLYTWKIFDYMNAERIGVGNELWNVDALAAMAKDFPVKVVKNHGQWVTTGDPVNYLRAQILFGIQSGINVKEWLD